MKKCLILFFHTIVILMIYQHIMQNFSKIGQIVKKLEWFKWGMLWFWKKVQNVLFPCFFMIWSQKNVPIFWYSHLIYTNELSLLPSDTTLAHHDNFIEWSVFKKRLKGRRSWKISILVMFMTFWPLCCSLKILKLQNLFCGVRILLEEHNKSFFA